MRWIDSGCPAGAGDDPLATSAPAQTGADDWVLGKPDYVVTPSERMKCPRRAWWTTLRTSWTVPFRRDAWLKGTVVRPDNRKLLHHVIVYLEYPKGYAKR